MDLEPGEQIIFQGHPSWRSTLTFYIKGLVVVAIVAVVVVLVGDTAVGIGAGVAAFGVLLVAGYVKRIFTTYTISNIRLNIRRGILSRDEQHTQITRVQNVNTEQSALERLLRVGTVDFDTAASGDFDFTFTGVANPHEVVDAVHRAQREADAMDRPSG